MRVGQVAPFRSSSLRPSSHMRDVRCDFIRQPDVILAGATARRRMGGGERCEVVEELTVKATHPSTSPPQTLLTNLRDTSFASPTAPPHSTSPRCSCFSQGHAARLPLITPSHATPSGDDTDVARGSPLGSPGGRRHSPTSPPRPWASPKGASTRRSGPPSASSGILRASGRGRIRLGGEGRCRPSGGTTTPPHARSRM